MTTVTQHPDTIHPAPPPGLPEDINLTQFMERFQDSIVRQVSETYTPTYQPDEHRDQPLPNLLRAPLGRQTHTIKAAAHSLRTNRGTTIVGEMGTGKTSIAVAAARTAGFKRVLVICPPHMIRKWKREVELTLAPEDAEPVIVHNLTQLQAVVDLWKEDHTERTLFMIMSREKAKLTHGWRNVGIYKRPKGEDVNIEPQARCVECAAPIRDEDGNPQYANDLASSKRRNKCKSCQTPLWEAIRHKNHSKPRIALSEYIKKKVKNFFDLFIGDEIHEYKAGDSGQGIAAGNIAQHCGRSLALTGTYMGGYSSSLFYLLYRFHPDFRNSYSYSSINAWIKRYGFYQYEQTTKTSTRVEHGRASIRRTTTNKPPKEIPGLMPDALFHLIGHTIFIRLSDVAANLPEYSELILTTPTETVKDHTGYSQHSAYGHLENTLKATFRGSKWNGRMAATYLQNLLAYPDGCTKGAVVHDPETGEELVNIPPLADSIYPKEEHLIELLQRERDQGRRCMVYASHTDTRDITERLKNILMERGIATAKLKAGSPEPAEREAWIERQVKNGVDTVICNPRLVQTGLDLIDFPTIIWFQPDYSVYTMRQASRRSWRIGQELPVRVYYMTYEDCLQTDALKLIAKKTSASLTVEGELPEEGLSSYGDTSQNVYMELAKQLAGQIPPPHDDLHELLKLNRIREHDDELELARPRDRTDSAWRPWDPDQHSQPNVHPITRSGNLLPTEPILDKGRRGKHGQLTMFNMEDFMRS